MNEWNCDSIPDSLRRKVEDVLRAEVDQFSAYLSGQVYGWIVSEDDGRVVGSCWGYYRYEDAKEDVRLVLDCYLTERAKRNEHVVIHGGG